MTESPTHEPSAEPRTARNLDRALRAVFLGLFAVALFSGYALKPSLNRDMRTFLKGTNVESVEEVDPEVELPFLPWEGRILSVWHRYRMPGTEGAITLRSYFSRTGEYRGTQTQTLPTLGARRSTGELEVAMLRVNEHYFEPKDSIRTLQFQTIMENLSESIDTSRMLGFVVFPVRYASGDNATPQDAEDAVVMHLWCSPRSDDEAVEATAKPCPEAARIVYSLEAQSIVQHDELL